MKPLALIDWPMVLKTSGTNLREHFFARQKRVKAQRLTTALALRANRVAHQIEDKHGKVKAGERLVVALVRVSPRLLDDDNLAGAFKAIRDEIAKYFGVNDGDRSRIRFEYAQVKGKPSAVQIGFAVERAP